MKKIMSMPSFAKSRRGNAISVLDAIVSTLWQSAPSVGWPKLTFGEITQRASAIVGYELRAPAIRGYVYRRPELFERLKDGARVVWRISKAVRSSNSNL